MCWGADFCHGCHLSPWAVLGESSALQYLTLRFLAHQQQDLFFHPNAVHLFDHSLLLLSMCCCLCLIFVVFPLKARILTELDFLCLPVLLQNLFIVWLLFYLDVCVFPHSNISEIIGFIESLMKQRGLWCCNVSSIWSGSWLQLTSVLRKEKGVKIDRRTHSYNTVAVTDEEEFFCSAVKICKVRKRMAAGF